MTSRVATDVMARIRVSPFLNTPHQRKEERARLVGVSLRKLRVLHPRPEEHLHRVVLVNGLLRALRRDALASSSSDPSDRHSRYHHSFALDVVAAAALAKESVNSSSLSVSRTAAQRRSYSIAFGSQSAKDTSCSWASDLLPNAATSSTVLPQSSSLLHSCFFRFQQSKQPAAASPLARNNLTATTIVAAPACTPDLECSRDESLLPLSCVPSKSKYRRLVCDTSLASTASLMPALPDDEASTSFVKNCFTANSLATHSNDHSANVFTFDFVSTKRRSPSVTTMSSKEQCDNVNIRCLDIDRVAECSTIHVQCNRYSGKCGAAGSPLWNPPLVDLDVLTTWQSQSSSAHITYTDTDSCDYLTNVNNCQSRDACADCRFTTPTEAEQQCQQQQFHLNISRQTYPPLSCA
jgi:hypothetical protein